jgi:hypothetical protein
MTVGTRVRWTHALLREMDGRQWFWKRIAYKTDPQGWLVGLRTLQNGEMARGLEDNGEFYGVFIPREYVRAALVTTSLRRKPILVPLDAITLEEEG